MAAGGAAEITNDVYWRQPFTPLATKHHLSTFIVLDSDLDQSPWQQPQEAPLPGGKIGANAKGGNAKGGNTKGGAGGRRRASKGGGKAMDVRARDAGDVLAAISESAVLPQPVLSGPTLVFDHEDTRAEDGATNAAATTVDAKDADSAAAHGSDISSEAGSVVSSLRAFPRLSAWKAPSSTSR